MKTLSCHSGWMALPLLGCLLLLSGCFSLQSRHQADPYLMVHHNWWNYYERGRLHMKDGNFAAARRDFETALGRIPGARFAYARERWRVRTYGMHMLEGYFPHRELGICLYELEQMEPALEQLNRSIELEPSARAKFYINRVQSRLVQANVPPAIRQEALPDWTSEKQILLTGSVQSTNRVAQVRINGEPEFIELAVEHWPVERTIPLREGRNEIEIVATDLSERAATTNLVVHADWTPPQIHVQRSGQTLGITCEDAFSLQRVEINGVVITPSNRMHTVSYQIKTNAPLHMLAADSVGNEIEWTLGQQALRQLLEKVEVQEPQLRVADAGKSITLYSPEYLLDLQAEDDVALREVSLNGEDLLGQVSPLFRTQRLIPLEEGVNTLRLSATDLEGNRVDEQVAVRYRPPVYLDRVFRLATMLAPPGGELPYEALGRRILYLISNALTSDPIRFQLLASYGEHERLKREHALSSSKLADPRAALKQGRRLDADLIMMPRLLDDAPGHTIYVQVVDAESGDLLFIEDVYLEDLKDLSHQLSGLVAKIEQRFPVIRAELLDRDGRFHISAGSNEGARKGMRFIAVRSEGPFENGQVVYFGGRPAELVISEVESEEARVIIPGHLKGNPVQPGDYVFSR